MGVPKRKTSKMRLRTRKAANRWHAPQLTKCPQCKKAKVTRLLSGGAGVIFKGSGFWETDYNRSSDYKSKEKADSGSTATSDKSAEPAPKTQTAPKKADPAPSASTTGTAAPPPTKTPPPASKKP